MISCHPMWSRNAKSWLNKGDARLLLLSRSSFRSVLNASTAKHSSKSNTWTEFGHFSCKLYWTERMRNLWILCHYARFIMWFLNFLLARNLSLFWLQVVVATSYQSQKLSFISKSSCRSIHSEQLKLSLRSQSKNFTTNTSDSSWEELKNGRSHQFKNWQTTYVATT